MKESLLPPWVWKFATVRVTQKHIQIARLQWVGHGFASALCTCVKHIWQKKERLACKTIRINSCFRLNFPTSFSLSVRTLISSSYLSSFSEYYGQKTSQRLFRPLVLNWFYFRAQISHWTSSRDIYCAPEFVQT